MERCTRCILPKSYPGLTFDGNGVCRYCQGHTRRTYRGVEALKTFIAEYLAKHEGRNQQHDCILRFSGGRDSSYLMYFLKEELGLKVLAYFTDNGFIPEATRQNIASFCSQFQTELVVDKPAEIRKCFGYHLRTWMHRPTVATSALLCTGCKLGYHRGSLRLAHKRNIPLIIDGWTPFEGGEYKRHLLRFPPVDRRCGRTVKGSMILGYAREIIRNPRWILNPYSFIAQVKEVAFSNCAFERKLMSRIGVDRISPFAHYMEWNEHLVNKTLARFGWRSHPGTKSLWRTDCDIAFLRAYIYKECLDFNDKVDGLSCLVREEQLTRDEALKRLEIESETPPHALEALCASVGVGFDDFLSAVRTARSLYRGE